MLLFAVVWPEHIILFLLKLWAVRAQGVTEAGTDPYCQVKQMDKHRAEPEKIRIWREEQAEMLKKKGELCCILSIVIISVTAEWGQLMAVFGLQSLDLFVFDVLKFSVSGGLFPF